MCSSPLDIEPLDSGPQDEISLLTDLSSAQEADGLRDIRAVYEFNPFCSCKLIVQITQRLH